MGHDRRKCRRGRLSRPFDPWSDLEWEEHDEARRIVAENPDGMTLEEVGAYLGITRERVRQIEAAALEKLRAGIDSFDVVELEDGTAAAVTDCERCGSVFLRRGRSKVCDLCRPKPKPKRAKKRRVVVERVDPGIASFKLSLNLTGW